MRRTSNFLSISEQNLLTMLLGSRLCSGGALACLVFVISTVMYCIHHSLCGVLGSRLSSGGALACLVFVISTVMYCIHHSLCGVL